MPVSNALVQSSTLEGGATFLQVTPNIIALVTTDTSTKREKGIRVKHTAHRQWPVPTRK